MAKKKSKIIEGFCQICGISCDEGIVKNLTIYGVHLNEICFACYCVPKDRLEGDVKQLNTVKEMVEHGWDKKEADFYIKAFKKYFKIRKNI